MLPTPTSLGIFLLSVMVVTIPSMMRGAAVVSAAGEGGDGGSQGCCPFGGKSADPGAMKEIASKAALWMAIAERFNDQHEFIENAPLQALEFNCPIESVKEKMVTELADKREKVAKFINTFKGQPSELPAKLLAKVDGEKLQCPVSNAQKAQAATQQECPCPNLKEVVTKLQALKQKYGQ